MTHCKLWASDNSGVAKLNIKSLAGTTAGQTCTITATGTADGYQDKVVTKVVTRWLHRTPNRVHKFLNDYRPPPPPGAAFFLGGGEIMQKALNFWKNVPFGVDFF